LKRLLSRWREELRAVRRSDYVARLHEFDLLLHAQVSKLPLRGLRIAATGGLIVAAAWLSVTRHESVFAALVDLEHTRPSFVALAVVAEFASIACYVALLSLLLRSRSVVVGARTLLSLTVIGIAMLNSLPGGQAISTVYWYEQLVRRRHVDGSAAAFALLLSTVLGIASLPLIAAAGLILGRRGFAGDVRVPIFAVAATVLAGSVLLRRRLQPAVLSLIGRFGANNPRSQVELGHLRWPFALACLNWLLDACALLAALAAFGERLPLPSVIVVYSLGQLAAAVPILPGGGGSVEATLIAGLVAAGGTSAAVVAAVVVYRLVSAWGLVPIGWTLWLLSPRHRVEPSTPSALAVESYVTTE
jgi:putative heme transporter